jgi:hypothetical protein
MADHGTRACYQRGCRRRECIAAHNTYHRAYQYNRKRAAADGSVNRVTKLPVTPLRSRTMGAVEAAVLAEISLLSTDSRPGLVEIACALARVLDDPVAVSQHSGAAHRLAECLERLRKSADRTVGRLASVRHLTVARHQGDPS